MTVTYTTYSKESFIISCNKEKHQDFIETLEGVWTSDNSGYIVKKEKESQIVKILNYLNMLENAKPRKFQTKYHREDSEDEYEEKETKVSSKKYSKPDPMTYYKSFSSKPVDFAKIHKRTTEDSDEDSEYSSSSYATSSSDGFPSPSSPKKNQLGQLVEVITRLEKKVDKLESKFK